MFRILSATLLISEILAANNLKYAAHAIRKDRDTSRLHENQSQRIYKANKFLGGGNAL